MTLIRVQQAACRANMRMPTELANAGLPLAAWSTLCSKIAEAESNACCYACAGEWCFCIVTGIFCIFFWYVFTHSTNIELKQWIFMYFRNHEYYRRRKILMQHVLISSVLSCSTAIHALLVRVRMASSFPGIVIQNCILLCLLYCISLDIFHLLFFCHMGNSRISFPWKHWYVRKLLHFSLHIRNPSSRSVFLILFHYCLIFNFLSLT